MKIATGLTDETLMKFGKYCGRKMKDVPDDWLVWFADNVPREGARPEAIEVLDYIDENESVIEGLRR